jgi:hypothetical protein
MNVHSFIAQNNRKNGLERRVFEGELELRASKSGKGPGQIVGYAAKFNKRSQDLGGFLEDLAEGCFDDVMDDDCRCLRNHIDDNLLGRTASGTLELTLDKVGLMYTCDLPNTQVGQDTAESIRRGDLSGSSFQFRIAQGGDVWNFDGPKPVRTVTRISRLYDVSAVTDPAYLDTSVDMRSFEAALESRKAFEEAEKVRRYLYIAKARLWLGAAQLP